MDRWRAEALSELIDIAHSISSGFSRQEFLERLSVSSHAMENLPPENAYSEDDCIGLAAVTLFALKEASHELAAHTGKTPEAQLLELRAKGWNAVYDLDEDAITQVIAEGLRYNRHFLRAMNHPEYPRQSCEENYTAF